MSKYFVIIERTEVIEVDASTEEQAIEKVQNQLLAQNPRDTAKISIATEVKIS